MKTLVTGAAGMLGAAVLEKLRAERFDVVATGRTADGAVATAMDIRDWESVQEVFRAHEPELVIHLAAATDVDRCEREPDYGFATNAFGTENVARACLERGAELVYVSTANVFNGEKLDPYTEYDDPGSINAYGQSKLAGERVVERSLERHYVFRAGWMVGGWDIDKKFVRKIVQLCDEQDQLTVVDDKFGSPTFTADFADHMMAFVGAGRYGLYHLANRGTASRWEIAVEIVRILGKEGEVEVLPVSSAEFPLPAPRPRSEMLRNFKLEMLGMDRMPHWKEALESYIESNAGRP